MRTFLLGALTSGVVLVLVAWALGVGVSSEVGPDPALSPDPPTAVAPTPPVLDVGAGRLETSEGADRSGEAAASEPFGSGEAWLRIGERFTFGEAAVRPIERANRAEADVLCQDIRHGVSLACPHGAGPVLLALSAVGMPSQPAGVADLVKDAPLQLPARNLWLLEQATPERPGVGFVRAADGTVYKVYLGRVEAHPEALRRRVLVRYEQVPSIEGGGELHLPVVDGKKPVPIAAREMLRKALSYQKSLRGASFINYLSGSYAVVDGLLPETILKKERFLLVDEPLTTEVVIKRRGAVFAAQGIDDAGVVVLDSYSGVGSAGDMAGRVDVKSYGYVYIEGDLTGTVNINSYATVVIEGDLRGTLRVRSYTDLLLRGRILGKLDCQGSCWSTFYFDGYYSRADLEALGDGFRSVTLHVRDSDLPVGKHKKIGSWREVIVGDKVWTGLAR